MRRTLTYRELGQIVVDNVTPEDIVSGYDVDPSDIEEVGRQALLWGDIDEYGDLN